MNTSDETQSNGTNMVLAAVSIRYIDLPRKLKKRIKMCLRKEIDKRWKDKEIKIEHVMYTKYETLQKF